LSLLTCFFVISMKLQFGLIGGGARSLKNNNLLRYVDRLIEVSVNVHLFSSVNI